MFAAQRNSDFYNLKTDLCTSTHAAFNVIQNHLFLECRDDK